MVNSCLICFGGLIVLGGGIWWFNTMMFMRRSMEAEGMIVDESRMQGKQGTSYAPIVEFQASNGQKVTFTEKLYGGGRGVGIHGIYQLVSILWSQRSGKDLDQAREELDKVTVVYDPEKPTRAHIKNFQYLYFVPVLLIVIGACISIAGISFFSGFLTKVTELLDVIIKWFPF